MPRKAVRQHPLLRNYRPHNKDDRFILRAVFASDPAITSDNFAPGQDPPHGEYDLIIFMRKRPRNTKKTKETEAGGKEPMPADATDPEHAHAAPQDFPANYIRTTTYDGSALSTTIYGRALTAAIHETQRRCKSYRADGKPYNPGQKVPRPTHLRHPLLRDYSPDPDDRIIIRVFNDANPGINTDSPCILSGPNATVYPHGNYTIQAIDINPPTYLLPPNQQTLHCKAFFAKYQGETSRRTQYGEKLFSMIEYVEQRNNTINKIRDKEATRLAAIERDRIKKQERREKKHKEVEERIAKMQVKEVKSRERRKQE